MKSWEWELELWMEHNVQVFGRAVATRSDYVCGLRRVWAGGNLRLEQTKTVTWDHAVLATHKYPEGTKMEVSMDGSMDEGLSVICVLRRQDSFQGSSVGNPDHGVIVLYRHLLQLSDPG